MPKPGVVADDPTRDSQARELSDRLDLPLNADADVLLIVRTDRVECRVQRGDDALVTAKPTWIDLTLLDTTTGPGRSLQNPLFKAVGIRKGDAARPHVVDCTAGFGEDAWLLASIGCTVEAYERHPVMFALLDDALQRAAHAQPETASRITLHHADAATVLPLIADRTSDVEHPTVVYLDPMFKTPRKTAPRKAMRLADFLLPDEADAGALFDAALRGTPGRVVVKRPRHAPLLSDHQPVHQHAGKALRFDVYHGAGES